MSERRYLLYCPVNGKALTASIDDSSRQFDIAFHDYSGSEYSSFQNVEYKFAGKGHKWPCVSRNLSSLERNYDFYGFIDNDIELSTEQLNKMFDIASSKGLGCCQPSLSWDSFASFPWCHRQTKESTRKVPLVEVMMPFLSREALETCMPTFTEAESGWGLDLVWAKLLSGECYVCDAVVARHTKPVESTAWVMSNGLTPAQERDILIQKYEIDRDLLKHKNIFFSLKKRLLLAKHKLFG